MKLLSKQAGKITASALVLTGAGLFRGILIGTDGVNDPVVTVFDNIEASGEEIIPTTTFDASALGLNGVTGLNRYVQNGIYILIACVGAVEVVPEYVPWGSSLKMRYE